MILMNAEQLKSMQAPLKQKYKDDPSAALVTLRAEGRAAGLSCKLLAAAIGLAAVAVIWPRRRAPGGTPLALMLLAAAFWAVCDAIELFVQRWLDVRIDPVRDRWGHGICPECRASSIRR